MSMVDTLHPLRRFYRGYLARYAWARKMKPLVLRAWFGGRHARHVITWQLRRGLYLVACRLTPIRARQAHWMQRIAAAEGLFFSMVSLQEYCEANKPQTYTLAKAEMVILGMPEVHPTHYRQHLHSATWPLVIPAVRAIEISDGEVMGKCDFVFARLKCLHHGLYRFERDLPAEEMHGMIGINAKKKLVARYAGVSEAAQTRPEAISLIGSASANYVHWLTETAPKLVLIDEIDSLKGYPLIIDAGLHPNILESLHCLNTHGRELVPLERGQVCKVDKLISISPVAYVPFDYRRGVNPEKLGIKPDWAMFVPRGLHALREKLLSRLTSGGRVAGQRLYLRRTSQFRQMRNATEVEALLHEFGYQVIEPEMLSFAEQVRLFSSAESIVAQAGAALGNMIFAPKDCRIVILSAWSSCSIYYYFSNLASIFGQECTYVLCDPDRQDYSHPAHNGLEVDIQALREAVGR